MRGQTKKRHIPIGACVVSKVGANSESLHCDEHFDTKLLLFRPKYLGAKCAFLQPSLRVNTGAICAFGRFLYCLVLKNSRSTGRIISTS